MPTYKQWSEKFVAIAAMKNKPSEIASKRSAMRAHLVPFFGKKRIDKIRFADIQDFVASRLEMGLKKKTVNNFLTILRRSLVVAKKRQLIESVPEIEWLRAPKPDFDFLDFEEAERLVKAADEEWDVMIFLALRTGMRLGELCALRWDDVDLVKGQIRICRSVTRGHVSTPKSNRSRLAPLSGEANMALKRHRHLRGELVFCQLDGSMLNKGRTKHPLWRACKRAGIRRIGWHVLRHTFASHLTMRGVPLKAVQELLGHATMEMTMRYAHLSPRVTRDAVRLLDEAPPFSAEPNEPFVGNPFGQPLGNSGQTIPI